MSDAAETANAVIVTDTVAVQENDEGTPSRVNDYAVLAVLGEGSFSKVYHCTNSKGEAYALKVLKKSFLKRKREYKKVEGKMVFCNALEKVQREVAIMKKLAHTNLVKLHEIIDSPADDKMFLVLELIQGGQVMNWDDKAFRYRAPNTPSGVLEKEDVRHCMRDVVVALSYLHANHICHRDIKPENILLAGSNIYKLADFGVAHMLDEENKTRLRSTEGTYHFLAPECTTGNEYDPFQVDIWALGVTLYAMLQGTLPFGTKAASLSQVMDSIREDPLVFGPETEPDCADVMRLMLEKDPNKRIRIQELKVHPWILEGSELTRFTPSNSIVVAVTQQEIEAAFTPVNNFILMTKLKMKMSSRLARARKSVELRHDLDLAELHTKFTYATPKATSSTLQPADGAATLVEAEVECKTPRPSIEMISSVSQGDETAAQATHVCVELKKHNNSLLKSMSDELDSLLSAAYTAPTSPSAATTDTIEALSRVQAGSHHSEMGPTMEDTLLGTSFVPILKSIHASPPSSPSLSHRLSRRISVNPGLPSVEPWLPPLEVSLSPASSPPAQSPASSSNNREHSDSSSSTEALFETTSPLRNSSEIHSSPTVRPSLGRRRSSEKENVVSTTEPSVMLQHHKSGSLSPVASEDKDTYAQALAEAKRKSSLVQRSHSSSPTKPTRVISPAMPVNNAPPMEISLTTTQPQPSNSGVMAFTDTKSSWGSSDTGSALIPLTSMPQLSSRSAVGIESLVLNTTPEDSPQTTRQNISPMLNQMSHMSSIAKALGECIAAEHHTGDSVISSSSPTKNRDTDIAELSSYTSARSEMSTSEKSPPPGSKLFQKRNSNITAVNGSDNNNNAFSQVIIGGSSSPKRYDPSSPTTAVTAVGVMGDNERPDWENPSFVDSEHGTDSPGSPSKSRRSTFIRVFSKHKSILEAHDSLQMLLRRKSSMNLVINDSEAYDSKIEDAAENMLANVASNVVANAGDSPEKKKSIRIGPTMSALMRSSSHQVMQQELAKPAAQLHSQKTVVCCVILEVSTITNAPSNAQRKKQNKAASISLLIRSWEEAHENASKQEEAMDLGWNEHSYSEGYPLSQGYGDEANTLTGENKPRILLMGLRRSGKSSIQRVVFHKMSPHETLFLEGTNSLDIKYIANNSFVQFQIWDFPGDYDFKEDLVYGGQLVNEEMIFGNCGSIVFVIDAQDEPYAEALARLHDTVIRAHRYNPDIFFEVFIHKVDGDLFLSDDHKIDCQREIQQQITDEINDGELDIHMSFYLTSIYDHSIFEAFSKVVQKLIPQLPTLENLLNILITSCNMEKSFLFDVVSKVYIATDSNPVDMQSYELCSDMIDVVIDVSCIYGMKDDGDGDGLAYDSESSSVIKLNNGMVLYLREVNNYLALVCLLRAENFMKQGIIDYNIDCFKSAIGDVFKVPEKNRIVN